MQQISQISISYIVLKISWHERKSYVSHKFTQTYKPKRILKRKTTNGAVHSFLLFYNVCVDGRFSWWVQSELN